MLRDDLNEFSKYAKEEMPESYLLINIHTAPTFKFMLTSVANSKAICTDPAFLKTNFGCPYVTGIDIFPLDALCNDEEEEDRRRQDCIDIVDATNHIQAVGTKAQVTRDKLAALGRKHRTTIHMDDRAERELRVLAEKLYQKYPMSEAERVAMMTFWVDKRNHAFDKHIFDEAVWLPFEYVHLPAPIGYDELLRGLYGDYMKIYKDGGIHEYPAFAAQERKLAEKSENKNPYRYSMPEELPAPRSIREDGEICGEMSSMLRNAHTNIQKLVLAGNGDAAGDLLQGCQNLAISLGTFIEEHVKGGEAAVHILEEYCERLYEESGAWRGEESVKLLDESIRQQEETLDKILAGRKKEVLFIPCRAEWWPTMEREWNRCMEDPSCEVYVTPIPYMIRDSYGEERSRYDDSALFPEYVKITSLEDYDLEARKPDEVYIQAPYDGWNSMFLIPEYYYAENLVKKVRKLIYLPCFEAELPGQPGDKSDIMLKVQAEQPAVLFSDEVRVKDEARREAWINALTAICGEEKREYWAAKIKASAAEDRLPEAEDKEEGRKTLVFQVNIAYVKKYGEKALDKVKEALAVIGGNADKLDCIFVPHETLTDGAEEDSETGKLCRDVLELAKSCPSIIYDEKREAVKDFARISAYYGNPGALAAKCANSGRATMIMAEP